ncbi:hypothetical protein EK21DRAFT_21411, partial [Setomelanomma holmii]
RNAKKSRLLALPAEIREQIWTYAFGFRTIHPSIQYADAHERVRRISFDPCTKLFHHHEVYELNLPNCSMEKGQRWREVRVQAHCNFTFIGSHKKCESEEHKYHPIVPPVCKLILHEAVKIAWRTSTFAFQRSATF